MAIHCGGIDFRNPVLTASGTFGYGKEFEGLLPLTALGGLVNQGDLAQSALWQSRASHLRDGVGDAQFDRTRKRRG